MISMLEKNIYDFSGNILICGSCLPMMEKKAYEELSCKYSDISSLCLERDHINMAITKISGILSTGKVNSITFASVNKSPHCTQLHYIKNELLRVMDKEKLPEFHNLVVSGDTIYEIDDKTLSLSKDLIKLSKINK